MGAGSWEQEFGKQDLGRKMGPEARSRLGCKWRLSARKLHLRRRGLADGRLDAVLRKDVPKPGSRQQDLAPLKLQQFLGGGQGLAWGGGSDVWLDQPNSPGAGGSQIQAGPGPTSRSQRRPVPAPL